MSSSTAPGYLEVDLAALARNRKLLETCAGGAELAAVVKADAYGLGMAPVATRLERLGCRLFFVATLAEASALRAALPGPEIYVFEGVAPGSERTFADQALRPVLNTPEQARRWLTSGMPCAVHVDTGMNRLGMSARQVTELAESLDVAAQASIALVMTHLACADRPEHDMNRRQVIQFVDLARRFPRARTSIGNSAGIFIGNEYRGDVVRAGIALFGGNPFEQLASPVEAVASLRARVLQTREVEADASVGYGATQRVVRGTRLAVVGVGYADGYPRALGGRGAAAIAGKRVPIVGRVSMDTLCLDVSELPRDAVELGSYVELFGREISVDEVAAGSGTISYEILTGLGARVERVYVD